MQTDLDFSCACGALRGVLHHAVPGEVCHLICYCRDCRAFAHHMGVADQLEPGGGSPLIQVLPARIEITAGAEHIACKRLTEKGLHRWYADCCGTPLANTVGTSKVPLAGMWRPLFADVGPLGPVGTYGFTKMALPGTAAPKKDKGLAAMLGGLLRRSAAAYLAGTARQSPFFDAEGRPVAEPKVLSTEERAAAYSA
ncbi:DUF6151 family protein [Puniceibacterium sediminis]|uniref:CENP-V/GFA domain-containing protein n=1 Tax=Puniceibacterium sediminis TaxID=1608407 RepID=A0A238V158_9RHOB|nr:DUF6151 family protein [Puniceibacterium sediminis]SNR28006.1 hypothetical protein SAMN06265370_101460 [Puniceibacterium sediminis]